MSRGSAARSLLSIGEVLRHLREDFPDVTISKIRFLESIGLVEPERTSSNYRKFSSRDLERLRYILAAQRDRYLPLKRIREELDDLDNGAPVADPPRLGGPYAVASADELPPAESFARDTSRLRLTRVELLERAGLEEEALTAMESYGLVTPRPGTTHYDADTLAVATAGEHSPTSAWRPATCAASSPRPTAKWGWCSSSSRRCAASAAPTRAPVRKRSSASWPPAACACMRPLYGPVCAADPPAAIGVSASSTGSTHRCLLPADRRE